MKTISFGLFSLLITGLTACNNNGANNANGDSTSSSTTTTVTSSNHYSARADSIRMNSQAGNYLNTRTGKPITLRMDTTTGTITDESGAPVKRYVDKRTWWVYDAASGDTVGSAEMNNGSLMYRGSNGDWEAYDKRWSDDTTSVSNTMSMDSSSMNSSNGSSSGTTGTSGHSKTKIKEHGNKVKTVEKTKE